MIDKFKEAITSATWLHITDVNKAATACVSICEGEMVEFAEWVSVHYGIKTEYGWLNYLDSGTQRGGFRYLTTQQLLELYKNINR